MGLTYQEAKRLGLEKYWPTAAKGKGIIVPPQPNLPPKEKTVEDGMNGLELAFWKCANEAKDARVFDEVEREPMRFRVVGDRWYKPDFYTRYPFDDVTWGTFWETKGHERAKDILKLIAAADRYQRFKWVLVKREKRAWQCRNVTSRGIGREVWCPDWLR